MPDLTEVERDLDEVTQPLLLPLRATKTLEPRVVEALMGVGRDLAQAAPHADLIPRSLVGKSWFLLTAMLAEADHAREPEPILQVAWRWAELLRQAFGPHW